MRGRHRHQPVTRIFRGDALADEILGAVRADPACARASLLVLRDASAPPAAAYAARIESFAPRAGFPVTVRDYPATLAELRTLLEATQGAVLPIHPLPDWIDAATLTARVGPDRDPEGLHPLHAGALALGRPGIVPPTADAAFRVAKAIVGPLSGKTATVVGASPVVGRPLALLLIAAGATVRVAQATTRDLAAETRDAEIVFSAVGHPGLLGRDHLREGAVGIDIGITRQGERLVGDIDAGKVEGHAAWLTHVPDGVGPVTVACLMRNAALLGGAGV
ncbi:hypothetical protein [Psychromarinibacter halotolerans]|uniref:hypothetical protein n=1 Tax=Psychromarinibacter halotolerans TaxID=1775175 RepID=UPI0036D391EA